MLVATNNLRGIFEEREILRPDGVACDEFPARADFVVGIEIR
jgi:hypothetical protein